MTDLIDNLYEFVSARRMGRMYDNPEYRSVTYSAQGKENRLRKLLDQEGNKLLTDLMNEQLLQFTLEMEAMFQSTIDLCRELNQTVW